MTVDLESYASPQIDLFKEAYRAVLTRDVSLLAKTLHKDFRHVIHPRSLSKLPINRDVWLATVGEGLSTPIQLDLTFHSIVDAPGKTVLHVAVDLKGFFGQDLTDESVWIIGFTPGEDGSLKIKEIEQFADTTNYIDLTSLVGKLSK
ncbi:hypothetical protein L210DRAFT_946865 [Boletus edulis BED1]|uniref:Uncharacterized protein n=1 Tax=Boletus edulis BED1 TaxID=1328754 RepID=A0AAD4BQB6_BOLED|nr:hypothetical protein L210DRAFT_946865 [Boletus edulis BED1]